MPSGVSDKCIFISRHSYDLPPMFQFCKKRDKIFKKNEFPYLLNTKNSGNNEKGANYSWTRYYDNNLRLA